MNVTPKQPGQRPERSRTPSAELTAGRSAARTADAADRSGDRSGVRSAPPATAPAAATDPLPHADDAGRATLRTIAALAGVHVSTVSRVLSPSARPDVRSASARTTERIRGLAREVGYAPNPHATGLRTSRSNLVGVLVPRLTDIVLATIYEGVELAAQEHGFHTFVANSRDQPDQRRQAVEVLLSRHVDGLVLGDTPVDAELADALAARGVPYVLVNRRAGDHPSVTTDDVEGGRLAARHLLAAGHRDVAVAAGEPYASTGVDRTAGFREVFAAAGHPVPDHRVRHSAFDVTGGRAAGRALLAGGPAPTAVFAVNDFAALGVCGALRDAGLRAGEDVAVVGYNDVPLAAELTLPLTTVRSPMQEMGRGGLELLLDRLAGREVVSRLLSPTLVVRESTTLWRPAAG